MLSPETTMIVDRYWASFFGCPVDMLTPERTYVVPHHVELTGYWGIYIFLRGAVPVISVPPELLDDFTQHAASWSPGLPDEQDIATLIGMQVERVVGPAYIGYADAKTYQPIPTSAARILGHSDAPAIERLKAACGREEWEHGGSDLEEPLLVGRYVGGELVSLAGYSIWGQTIAHIAIVTHPDYRGSGYGTECVSVIGQEALKQELVPQYRTLERNTASIKIAARLGYTHYATTIAVRLAPLAENAL